jgi:hypothetical protein
MSDPVANTVSAPAQEYATPETTRDLNLYSYGFFIASCAMALEGLDIYNFKLSDIYNRRDLFPARIENVFEFDDEWALQTEEITAW